MKAYDIDGDGNIGYEEFLRGLRDELSERKLAMVERTFATMDQNGNGFIGVKDIAGRYDVSQHKDFISKAKTADQILAEFLNSFDGARGNNDGKVTHAEWVDYYTDLSSSTPSDDYFCVMMEQAWGMGEDEQSKPFKDQTRELVSLMRQRLITVSNGHQEEYALKKMFNDFDSNGNGVITLDELAALMAHLKISCERKYLQSLLSVLDKNKSGTLEYDEFAAFVIYDPYK